MFVIPDGVDSMQNVLCSYQTVTTEVRGDIFTQFKLYKYKTDLIKTFPTGIFYLVKI